MAIGSSNFVLLCAVCALVIISYQRVSDDVRFSYFYPAGEWLGYRRAVNLENTPYCRKAAVILEDGVTAPDPSSKGTPYPVIYRQKLWPSH